MKKNNCEPITHSYDNTNSTETNENHLNNSNWVKNSMQPEFCNESPNLADTANLLNIDNTIHPSTTSRFDSTDNSDGGSIHECNDPSTVLMSS